MTWQLATAKIYNGSTWINAAGGNTLAVPTGGANVAYNLGNVTATASATPHTKGAWIELVASTAEDCHRVMVTIGATFSGGVASPVLLDIGVGAAGAETVVLADYAIGYNQYGLGTDVPCYIPSGSRVAARIQSAIISKTVTVGFGFAKNATTLSVNPSASWQAFGIVSASSRGTTVIPGANVKGSWTQITADSGTAKKWLYLAIQGNNNSGMQTANYLLDIGVGAAGSETAIVNNFRFSTSTSEVVSYTSLVRGFFLDIPANSRLSVRAQVNTGSVTSAFYIDASLYGVDEVGSL